MHVQYCVRSATLRGIEGVLVDVEVLVSSGLPSFSIVGMPDTAVQEARERVKAAIRASGFSMPGEKIVVNLAPGAIKKTGSGFDLPIAVGILAATKQIPFQELDQSLFIGELSLEGQIRPVTGLLAFALCARRNGLDFICAEPEDGMIGLKGLKQVCATSLGVFRKQAFSSIKATVKKMPDEGIDYSDVAGLDFVKRAFQIAAVGNHGILLMEPPGSGKTMLASRLPSILPPLTEDEKLETALVHSVSGLDISRVLTGERPFRSPHHSMSTAGLVGGGNPVRPGEISLAHNGILFLDEISEYKPSTLQGIRQPMESERITITRADGNLSFPARFMLVAASNPCPCGYYGDPEIECSCSESQIRSYQNRIGGPLMDRIGIRIDVWRSDPTQVLQTGQGQSSSILRQGVLQAREFMTARRAKNHLAAKQESKGSVLIRECSLSSDDKNFLEEMATLFHMSGRGIMKTLSIARTIADIDKESVVSRSHLCERSTCAILKELDMLSGERMVLEANSELFPPALRSIPHPAKRLYLIGDPHALKEGLAVIGARKATPYGLACAQRFSGLAARKDVTIISGGALGCDAAAHKAALEEKGQTVVFLGGGCDQLYPKKNKHLFQRIINEGGAVVSEYDWEQAPMKYGFRARNRLIAGLARATLIVEAGLPSGTFSTADEALAANREVLVVPGSIASKISRGANRLLYQGAIPIVDDESFEDVLFSLFGVLREKRIRAQENKGFAPAGLPGEVYEALCAETLRIDELLVRIASRAEERGTHGELMQVIVELEKDGLIARYPDGRYGAARFQD